MTELHFKGKEFVFNHHLTVPHRPLEMHPGKGIGEPRKDGNLIIQGDNLHALKALLPTHAGKVDCIFIDPPYNTGNEGWCYNDKVNSPMIKEWLDANPIGIDDGLRHDKWCAMMWPRLKLLHELLADWGSIWITLDDNEAHRAKLMLDEIFSEAGFVANIVWQKRYVANVTAIHLSDMHDHLLVYSKKAADFELGKIGRTEKQAADYKNPDNDVRGPWRAQDLSASKPYSAGVYTIEGPNGDKFDPPPNRYWRMNKAQYEEWLADGRITFGVSGKGRPMLKRFLSEAQDGLTPVTWWDYDFAGHNKEATLELKQLHQGSSPFDTPKPKRLIGRVLELIGHKDAIVLDSFAGSGTTAHAVLEANNRDGGNRRFILVEMEDYADTMTAERVRRVINGYEFKGITKTELLRDKISWSKLRNAEKVLKSVEKIEAMHGDNYDAIKKTVKDGELIVTGEKNVEQFAEGLGGEFTYCTLGAAIEMDKILTGETLPTFGDLATVLFHTATNLPGDPAFVNAETFFMGETAGQMLWLIYRPELDWLKTPQAALTLTFARGLSEKHPDARHLVFAPANHTNPKMLAKDGIKVEFAPLPYALYRVERT